MTDLETLAAAFHDSWLDSPRCVEFLEKDVLRRQNEIVLGRKNVTESTSGWRVDHRPLKLSDLVRMVAVNFRDRTGSDCFCALTVSLGCALVGELLITVRTRPEGEILKLAAGPMGGRRFYLAKPFDALRDTLCHPGLLAKKPTSNVDNLIEAVLAYSDQSRLVDELRRTRHAVGSVDMARWAIDRVDELGAYEIVQAALDDLRTRKIAVGREDERRVETAHPSKEALERLIVRHAKAKNVTDLLRR